ncbi:MAG: TIGR03085 family metal-binding protein [Propionibacteriaceae bacterium]
MPWVPEERRALVATLRQTDPHADTLCDGWDVRRLLAHLIVREQEPATAVKDALSRKPPGAEPGLGRLAATTATSQGYQALVSRFAAGPPAWSPMSWAGEQLNLIEYVIHHEDIRRAGPDPVEPRPLPEAETDAIWRSVGLFGRLAMRRSPVGVVLTTPAGAAHVVKKGRAGVSLVGDPVELALYLQGRRECARVEVTGLPETVSRFVEWVSSA